ncbi:hypothetical protein AB1Y20_017189 [Prymnesium parvum]|uniref:NADH dehydrogenase n=1 Tax=Prymnesium parvum TaxID=97485 RepID=A0AB34ICW0_PRYPA
MLPLLPLAAALLRPPLPPRPPVRMSSSDFDAPLRTFLRLSSRLLDTAEDAVLLARRLPARPLAVDESLERWKAPSAKPRVLVVGFGWGAHALVKDRPLRLPPPASPPPSPPPPPPPLHPALRSTPMLGAGTVEYRSITEPARAANPRAAFLEGSVSHIDPSSCTATIEFGGGEKLELTYDICVYAAGVRPSVTGVPGENCLFLKEVEDALKLRRAVASSLEKASRPGLSAAERARLLTFVVVGGGPTGVEYTGELSDFINDALRRLYPQLLPFARVVLLHGGADLLPGFDEALRQKALESLRSLRVDVRLQTRVEEVLSPSQLTVRAASGELLDLPCGAIIWAAGTGPHALTQRLLSSLPPPADPFGRLAVDAWLRVVGAPPGTLFALGDAAACGGLPQTAQVAAQQGAYLARMLNRGYDLARTPPAHVAAGGGDVGAYLRLRGAVEAPRFEFINLGILAYVGGGEALSQVQLGERRLLTEAGSTGFLLWRSVYVVKQVSPRTRLLVLFDWFKTKLFGRDVTLW